MLELTFSMVNQTTTISYGETLSSLLKPLAIREPILFLTNQRYYDLFSEKMNQFFADQANIDWYICTNSAQCNNLTELAHLLDYVKRFPENQRLIVIGFGNEGIMELASFFQKHTILSTKFWLIPVSARSFGGALTNKRSILQSPYQAVLETENLPERIFFDQTISDRQVEGKQIDFLTFVVCGLICDYGFLQNLYKNYSTQQKLHNVPFAGMLEEMIHFYQEEAENLATYGKLFEQAFYLTENGHLLSASMKKFLGLLFQLVWNIERNEISFQLKNFFIWLKHLGYPIDWLEQLSEAEYLENVLILAEKSKKILVLEKIGIIEGYHSPNENELLKMMTRYQRIVNEIRGN